MWLDKILKKFPTVKAEDAQPAEEEDLVDPQVELREKCNDEKHIQSLKEKYDECNNRVNSRSRTAETCVEELFDWIHAVDHCVTKDLFKKLK